jgi:hypothetical protein
MQAFAAGANRFSRLPDSRHSHQTSERGSTEERYADFGIQLATKRAVRFVFIELKEKIMEQARQQSKLSIRSPAQKTFC